MFIWYAADHFLPTVLKILVINFMNKPSWYVYFLRSLSRDYLYIGSTDDLDRRLFEHNSGHVQSTKAFSPFKIDSYIAVSTETKARELEKYFKTGSGKAILNKRILSR